MRNIIIIIISFIFLFPSCTSYRNMKQGFVADKNYFTEIPFTYENGFILIPVTIQGEVYNFLLDTGATLNVIDPTIVDGLNLRKLNKGIISNGNDSRRRIQRVEIAAIEIGGIKFRETVSMVWDISKFTQYVSCEKVDGFIGNNLMRKSNWQIDYRKKVIRITDSSTKLNILDNHKKIKMNSGTVGNVLLNLKIDEKYKDFTFDTGYNGFAQTGDTTLLTSSPTVEKIGITGANFTGSKKGRTYYKILKNFSIDEHVFKSPTYFFIKPENSSVLGNEFFEHYRLTIDWENDYLILDKQEELDYNAFNIYEIGFFPNFEKNMIIVANIYEKSNLKDKIRLESKVLKINGIDLDKLAEEGKLCEFWLDGWDKLGENNILNIVVEYDEKQQEVEVKKIRLDVL